MDRTWAHHSGPETKLQSKLWKHAATSLMLVKFCKNACGGKVKKMRELWWLTT